MAKRKPIQEREKAMTEPTENRGYGIMIMPKPTPKGVFTFELYISRFEDGLRLSVPISNGQLKHIAKVTAEYAKEIEQTEG